MGESSFTTVVIGFDGLRDLRRTFASWLQDLEVTGPVVVELLVAVVELAADGVQACGEAIVTVQDLDGSLRIEVVTAGHAFEAPDGGRFDELDPPARRLLVAQASADSLELEADETARRAVLVKRYR